MSIHLLFPTATPVGSAFPCSSASCQGLSAPDTNLGPLVFGCWGESLPLQKQKSYGCCEQDATTGIAKGAKTKTQCHHDVTQVSKKSGFETKKCGFETIDASFAWGQGCGLVELSL